MSDAEATSRHGRMEASEADPTIGVHGLTEFVFCLRAGLCLYEQQGEVPVEETEPVILDFVPRYDLREIEQALKAVLWKIWAGLAAAVLLTALAAALALFMDHRFIWCTPVGWIAVAIPLARPIRSAMTLAGRRAACLNAKPCEPEVGATQNQPVRWWDLLQAGFMSIAYKERLLDPRWKLAGLPWRVLRRGSLRIPVFRQLIGDGRIHRQHVARMAAYCHLLETCEGAESPYGVVLFGYGYEGVAIPNSPGARKVFHDELLKARETIKASAKGDSPPSPAPEELSRCWRCPIGEPCPYEAGVSRFLVFGKALPVHGAVGRGGHYHHSHCGDRFGWLPPHEKAVRKGLRLRG